MGRLGLAFLETSLQVAKNTWSLRTGLELDKRLFEGKTYLNPEGFDLPRCPWLADEMIYEGPGTTPRTKPKQTKRKGKAGPGGLEKK